MASPYPPLSSAKLDFPWTWSNAEVCRASPAGTRACNLETQRRDKGELTMFGFIIALLIIGLLAGFIARALVPGSDPLGIGGTVLLGVVGSFVGGFLGWVLFGKDFNEGALQPSGLIGSILGSIVALLVYRASTGRNRAV
jgi:uncharacterized membrane protein YeaQ/YmgE (transglycosylase-associated protein family)